MSVVHVLTRCHYRLVIWIVSQSYITFYRHYPHLNSCDKYDFIVKYFYILSSLTLRVSTNFIRHTSYEKKHLLAWTTVPKKPDWLQAGYRKYIVGQHPAPENPIGRELDVKKSWLAELPAWKKPDCPRAEYRKHLSSWASNLKPLTRQWSIAKTSIWPKFCLEKMLLTEILLGKNRISNSCPESPQLCLHVTFHVQGYK